MQQTSWEAVNVGTFLNFFQHCRIQSTTEESTEVPFADIDKGDEELEELVKQIDADMPLTMREYVATNEEIDTCVQHLKTQKLEAGVAGNGGVR